MLSEAKPAPVTPKATSELPYDEVNPGGTKTIIFIHGAFSDRHNWNLVTPHLLKTYHLLLPDLPGHGKAVKAHPHYSKATSASLLAQLIRAKAVNGRAHVVGVSLGASVAVELASNHPDIVNSMFVSGFKLFPTMAGSTYAARGLWLDARITSFVPRSIVRWLMDGTDIPASRPERVTLPLCQEILDTITLADSGGKWPSPWPARTLIVCAGKSGILPTADHAHDAIRMRDIGREGNNETAAYTHAEMRHPWDRQAPELFAATATAWFEGRALPEGFVQL